MSETQGQIHGQISRNQMHEMWAPYGERLTISAEVSDNPTPPELVMMYAGADKKTRVDTFYQALGVRGYIWPAPKNTESRIYRFLLDGANDKIVNHLLDSYDDQAEAAQKATEKVRDSDTDYLDTFSRALGRIADEGVIAHEQADIMRERLYDQYGNPQMQEAPMTKVQMARLHALTHDGGMPDSNMGYATDLNFGLVQQPINLTWQQEYHTSNRAHELLHSVQGLEIYDITCDDGLRLPILTAIGHYLDAAELTTGVSDDTGFDEVENTELAEGFVEYVNMRMHIAEPALGEYKSRRYKSDYASFRSAVAEGHKEHPELFYTITEASLFEDHRSPTAKKDILAEMHELGKAVLGSGGIKAKIQAKVKFSEIYSNDKRPDIIAGLR